MIILKKKDTSTFIYLFKNYHDQNSFMRPKIQFEHLNSFLIIRER